ncbi:MAG: ATP synthase subunit I [Terracidiphilus sp.]
MSDEIHPFADLTDEGLEALLKRAIRITLILGLLASLILWKASGWRNAAMLGAGTAVSAASIFEWRRLVRVITARLDKKQTPRGASVAVVFFLLRLIVFAAVIYGSLKYIQGSGVALLCGLALALLAIVWEALRLLRD